MAVPNNQCKKYFDVLIAVEESHYSTLNSYVDFWHRFLYLNVSRLITSRSDAVNKIQSQLDEFSLEKQLPECIKKLPFHILKDIKRQYNDVFDFAFKNGSHTVLINLPESLDGTVPSRSLISCLIVLLTIAMHSMKQKSVLWASTGSVIIVWNSRGSWIICIW